MTVMTVTTCMLALVMLVTWNTHPLLVLLFLAVYLPLEGAFLSATLVKVLSGGEAKGSMCCSYLSNAGHRWYCCVLWCDVRYQALL
jgi:K+ transporter